MKDEETIRKMLRRWRDYEFGSAGTRSTAIHLLAWVLDVLPKGCDKYYALMVEEGANAANDFFKQSMDELDFAEIREAVNKI